MKKGLVCGPMTSSCLSKSTPFEPGYLLAGETANLKRSSQNSPSPPPSPRRWPGSSACWPPEDGSTAQREVWPMSADHSSDDRDPVDRLADEFVARQRRGERPSLSEYTGRYPELADEIRDLFPLLIEMEDARPSSNDEAEGPGPGLVTRPG